MDLRIRAAHTLGPSLMSGQSCSGRRKGAKDPAAIAALERRFAACVSQLGGGGSCASPLAYQSVRSFANEFS